MKKNLSFLFINISLVFAPLFFSTSIAYAQSPTVSPTCSTKSKGDANCNGVVDGTDYSIWLNSQCVPGTLQTCASYEADFNGDGRVDDTDLAIWTANRSNPTPTVTPVPLPITAGSCTCQNGVVVTNGCISPKLPFCTATCACSVISPAP